MPTRRVRLSPQSRQSIDGQLTSRLAQTQQMRKTGIQNFPAEPGSYAMVMQMDQACILQVGRLGPARLQPGIYVYSGSAWGPGGLRARLERHLKDQGKLHWHIDYLRSIARVTTVFTLTGSSGEHRSEAHPVLRPECLWSQALANLDAATIPASRFGASDCRSGCPAHLVGFEVVPDLLQRLLGRAAGLPGQRIQVWTIMS